MKFDHFIVNIDKKYQQDKATIENVRNMNFPYQPKWGKGTKGFKVSNLWIGNEYLEMVRILKPDGGGWVPKWTQMYQQGQRGMICLMLDVNDMDSFCASLLAKNIAVTSPKWLEFKWLFNLMTRRMPWRNCYIPFFENVPFQIGFQEMKDEKARYFMKQYMVPNSSDVGINGIYKAIIKGTYTKNDFGMILKVFGDKAYVEEKSIKVNLTDNQILEFIIDTSYQIELFTNSSTGKLIEIENIKIYS